MRGEVASVLLPRKAVDAPAVAGIAVMLVVELALQAVEHIPPFPFDAAIAAAADRIEPDVVAWRRDLHQNPELGNRELRTSRVVAEHLRSLGFDAVREKVAHTGVVGLLKGGKPGPVVALRADMDALPVVERVDLAFNGTVR